MTWDVRTETRSVGRATAHLVRHFRSEQINTLQNNAGLSAALPSPAGCLSVPYALGRVRAAPSHSPLAVPRRMNPQGRPTRTTRLGGWRSQTQRSSVFAMRPAALTIAFSLVSAACGGRTELLGGSGTGDLGTPSRPDAEPPDVGVYEVGSDDGGPCAPGETRCNGACVIGECVTLASNIYGFGLAVDPTSV